MKVVIAPDSFKDALIASDAVRRIADGLRSVVPDLEIDWCPIADGGEGFAEALLYQSWLAESQTDHCFDAAYRVIEATWSYLQYEPDRADTAIIELAQVSGIERIDRHLRNPMLTTTVGTGVLIARAIEKGVSRILLGIGSSATNDAGCGIAQALGVRFFDTQDRFIEAPMTGGMLRKVARIDTTYSDQRINRVSIQVACDVTNPLTGPNGAAHVYAPQKGAIPEQVEQLDAGLRHMAKLWRDQLGIDVENMPGAGAAGGVGGGLVAMLGAKLVPGAELVLDTINFDARIQDADLVITGEGRLDSQSLQGKAAMAVAKRAAAAGVPCFALVGSVGDGADQALAQGLTGYRVIGEGLEPAESIRRTGELLQAAAAKLAEERLA